MRCRVCNGQKKISPLGFMLKDCPACNATGYEIAQEIFNSPVDLKPVILEQTVSPVQAVKTEQYVNNLERIKLKRAEKKRLRMERKNKQTVQWVRPLEVSTADTVIAPQF